MIKIIGYIALGIVVVIVGGVIFMFIQAQNIGVPDTVNTGDTLAPCPDSPNCVSTLATDEEHSIDPIAYTGTMEDAQAKLMAVLSELPRTTVVVEEPGYVHIESRSPTMGFPDDAEFMFDDEAKLIQFRSAARMGESDLGKNRERMEAVRTAFLAE